MIKIRTRRSIYSLSKSIYPYIRRIIFALTMCYIYVDFCIFCDRQEIYGMQLCMNRMRIGLGLSYAYKSEVINENGQSYVKVPSRGTRSRGATS